MELELTGFGEVEGVELLQKLPIFAKLTFEETNQLAAIMQRSSVPAEHILIEENSLGDALWIVQSGEVKVSRGQAGGEHLPSEELGRLGVGDLFGEMSLIDDLLTSARVTTTQPSTLLKLPKADFEKLLRSDDRLAVKVYQSFARTLSDRLRRANLLLQGKHALEAGVR